MLYEADVGFCVAKVYLTAATYQHPDYINTYASELKGSIK